MAISTAERVAGFFAAEEHRSFAFPPSGQVAGAALMLHGFTGTPRELRALGLALAEAGIAARGPLLPGFGEQIGRLNQTRAADWLATARAAWAEAAAGVGPAVLVGFSMGGALALHLAATSPRPPDRLILLAPLWRFADPRARFLPVIKHVVRGISPFAEADLQDPAVREVLLWMDPTLDLDDPATVARLRRQTRIATPVLDSLRAMSLAAGRLAPRVRCPTLVLQGRQDTIVLPRHTRGLLARLGGPVTYHELPVDHVLVFENRAAWPRLRELVVAFATGRPARLEWAV